MWVRVKRFGNSYYVAITKLLRSLSIYADISEVDIEIQRLKTRDGTVFDLQRNLVISYNPPALMNEISDEIIEKILARWQELPSIFCFERRGAIFVEKEEDERWKKISFYSFAEWRRRVREIAETKQYLVARRAWSLQQDIHESVVRGYVSPEEAAKAIEEAKEQIWREYDDEMRKYTNVPKVKL